MTFDKNNQMKVIRVAILAEEPIGWGSGKHYFPVILDGYNWSVGKISYKISTSYIFDKDILNGKLNTSDFDVFLVPGGGVGDGQSMVKGLTFLPKVRRWKKNIGTFVRDGGGYIGICGGTALITDLKTGEEKPHTFLERLYNKSSLGISCVSSYYKSFAYPLFYPFQKKHPEKIGAAGYVFSFAPGETVDGVKIHTGGVPLDFQILKDNPVFSDFKLDMERIRWWGGPALILPKKPDRDVKLLAKYPVEDLSENKSTRIYAWRYNGGIFGLFLGLLKAAKFIKKENIDLKNLFVYTYYMAGNWELTNKIINLDYSNRPAITTEIYPNNNKGRILLCSAHPEYMIWWKGHIEEVNNPDFNCLGAGLHKWKDISPLSKDVKNELTHTWWMIRRFVAWAAKIPDNHLPPIEKEEITEKVKTIISENIFWDGSYKNQMKNI